MIKLANFSGSADKRRYGYILTQKEMAEQTAMAGLLLATKLEDCEALGEEILALRSEFGHDIEAGVAIAETHWDGVISAPSR